jgi:hypothetical protein
VRDAIAHPVVLLDGMILDGRARVHEAMQHALACPCRRFDAARDLHPVIVIGEAAARRLTKAQCAVLAVRLLAVVASRPVWLERHDRGMAARTRTHEGCVPLLRAFRVSDRQYQRAKALPDDLLDAVDAHRISLKNAFVVRGFTPAARHRLVMLTAAEQKAAIDRLMGKHTSNQRRSEWVMSLDSDAARFFKPLMDRIRRLKL